MRSLFIAALVAASAMGCDASTGAARDAAPSCADLDTQYRAAIAALPDDCTDVGDCMLVGGQPTPTCDCSFAVGSCGGNPVGRTADLTAANALAAQLVARCQDDSSTKSCDCAPSELACVDHHCAAITRSCLLPVDAGLEVDAAP